MTRKNAFNRDAPFTSSANPRPSTLSSTVPTAAISRVTHPARIASSLRARSR
jgi:hypothetical protein